MIEEMAEHPIANHRRICDDPKRRLCKVSDTDFTRTFGDLAVVTVLETIMDRSPVQLSNLIEIVEMDYHIKPQKIIDALRFCIRNYLIFKYRDKSKTMLRIASNNRNMNRLINLKVIWNRENAKKIDTLSYL